MRVAVKKPHIKVNITGVGVRLVEKALRQAYGDVQIYTNDAAVDITTTEWWKKRQAIAHPGEALWTYRDNAGLTLENVSELTGIAVSHLSAMENGKRTIGVRTARKLGKAFRVDHRMFL